MGFITGLGQQTAAVRATIQKAQGRGTTRRRRKNAKKMKTKSQTRSASTKTNGKKYQSAAWMAKIRKMRGKKKKKK